MDMGDPSPGDLSHGDLHWQTQPLETQAPWGAFGTHTIDFLTFLCYRRHFGYIHSISLHFFTTGSILDTYNRFLYISLLQEAFWIHTIDFFTFLYYRRHFGYIQSISVHFFTTGGMGDPSLGDPSLGDPSLGDLSRGDLHWQTQPLETQAPWETRIREAHN